MDDRLAAVYAARARRLAAAAAALNRTGGGRAPFHLAFLSDRRRGPEAIAVAQALPAGSAVILRDYDDPERRSTARALANVAAARGVILMIGADARLARDVGAHGVHLRACDLAAPPSREGLLLSAACHSAEELERAAAIGADIALLSPAFPTASHPDTNGMGPERFKRLAALSPIPVLALGGVDETNASSLAGANVVGIAAISAFAAPNFAGG